MNNRTKNYETPSQALARELDINAQSDLGLVLLRCVRRWEETKNPHWIDLAIVIVTEADLPIPPCLQIMASHVANRRLNGMEDVAGGASVIKEEIKGLAFACMAILISNGATIDVASMHAANATAAIFGSHLHKASSLAKEYSTRRKAEFGLWERLINDATSNNDGIIDILLKHLSKIPPQDPGNRR